MDKKQQPNEPQAYGRKLSIRLTDDEYQILERKAADYGGNISTAIRQLIFGKSTSGILSVSDGDAKYKTLLAVQQCRSSFKKIASRFNDAVAVYDRSIDAIDEAGRRIVSTHQTIRHLAGLEDTLMGIQKNLNVVFDALGIQPVYYAARTGKDTRAGSLMAGYRSAQQAVDSGMVAPEGTAARALIQLSGIPLKDRYMFKANITGVIANEPTSFVTKKGNDMMKFSVRINAFVGGKENPCFLDVVRPRTDVYPFLKKGAVVTVFGDMEIEKYDKNSQVVFVKTVFADTIVPVVGSVDELPPRYRYMMKAIITGSLMDDAMEYTTKKETVMMRFRVEVLTYIGGRETSHQIIIERVKNGLFPYLKKGVGVTVVGDLFINEQVDPNNQITLTKSIYADEIKIPPQ